jgi:hypothetical protein
MTTPAAWSITYRPTPDPADAHDPRVWPLAGTAVALAACACGWWTWCPAEVGGTVVTLHGRWAGTGLDVGWPEGWGRAAALHTDRGVTP